MSAYSFILYTFILGFLHISASLGIQSFKIDTKIAISTVDKRFLSIAIDTNLLRHDWRGLKVCDKLTTLTKGLQPAYLRIGGTAADFLTFDNKASNPTVSHEEEALFDDPIEDYFSEMNFTITRSDLDKTHEIASNAGWDVVFDLNVLKRRKNGSWDPTNPLEIMRYVRDKGYHFAWQLGNEPNHFSKFGINMTASQLGKDYTTLREIVHNDPSLGTMIVGPDANALEDLKARDFLKTFLESGGNVVNAVTWHHYYLDGRTATIEDFYKATILDNLAWQLKEVSDIVVSKTPPHTKAWIGETSSAYGGGAPGLSDRYVAGFMWLDKLGLSARLNEDVVIRQTLYGGRYALIDFDLNPNPDYWLSLLYKRLVGTKVLEVDKGLESGRVLRVYAHCTNHYLSHYSPGSITIMAMNIDPSKEATFCLTEGLQGLTVDQYLLTPSNGDPRSQFVSLNGKVLKLIDDKTLPSLDPQQITSDRISLPPLTMGFFVVPQAHASACNTSVEQ